MTSDTLRSSGEPTRYDPIYRSVTADVLQGGFITATCILAFSFLVVLPGIRGKERWSTFIRGTTSIFIGAVIMLANYGQNWEVGEVHANTLYKANNGKSISADIGVKLGLRSVNITLHGTPEEQLNETIDYNERFWYGWEQGRDGYGKYASIFNKMYKKAKLKGLPFPILWIAEYFTMDKGALRWGRYYRQAGYYTHIMMWTAFPLWLLTNISFFMVIRYGGYFLTMTGISMLIAITLFGTIRNFLPLTVHFPEVTLKLHWGWCFWITLITGAICVILGCVVVIMDSLFPEIIHSFFGVDLLHDYDDYYEDAKQKEEPKDYHQGDANNTEKGSELEIENHGIKRRHGPSKRAVRQISNTNNPFEVESHEDKGNKEEINLSVRPPYMRVSATIEDEPETPTLRTTFETSPALDATQTTETVELDDSSDALFVRGSGEDGRVAIEIT